jgi:hypothetical protein
MFKNLPLTALDGGKARTEVIDIATATSSKYQKLDTVNLLQTFRLAQYRVILTAREPIFMPRYAGSTLRGGFGQAFRKLVCTMSSIECRDCTLKGVCPYAYIFETAPPDDAAQLRGYSDVPRPFVIDPLETHGDYGPGEPFEFLLTLIGRAIDYLPYFLVSFRELGEIGIGRGRGRFQLTEVAAENGQDKGESIYSWETETVTNLDSVLSFEDIRQETTAWPTDQLTVRFLTPTRITYSGQLTDELPFHVLIQRLMGRISALQMDFKEFIAQATQVETVKSDLRWHDWTRYSARQDSRMKLGGLLGSITYAGELKPFLPFIALGQYVHVGKNGTFGLGKYRIV